MNESDRVFARKVAVLYKFLELVRRALLEEADERRMANLFEPNDFPKPRVSVENLEESVKNGLPLPIAEYSYYQIERNARRHIYKLRMTRGHSDCGLNQVRAKPRGEELESKSEDQIEREASKWVNNLWNEAGELQAAA